MAAGCMLKANPDAATTRPCLHACYLRILLMLDQGVRHGPQRVCTLYIHGLCQRSGCDCANQLYFSFGLDDRLADPYGDKVL